MAGNGNLVARSLSADGETVCAAFQPAQSGGLLPLRRELLSWGELAVPAMSTGEVLACRNPLWRSFTGRVIIPWVFVGQSLDGEVLELGTGAGANAAALLRRYPGARITATDIDPVMLESARVRLARFGTRAVLQSADAAALQFDDASFDAVVSMIMLHHVGNLGAALRECSRVLRPGGLMVGYDLTRAGPAAWIHRNGQPGHGHDLATPDELRAVLAEAGFSSVRVAVGLGGVVARFSANKRPIS